MAGDIGIHEQAIVGGAGAPDAGDLAVSVVGDTGGATHQYGPRLLIAAVPPYEAQVVERQVPSATVTAEVGAIPEATTSGLDEVGALGQGPCTKSPSVARGMVERYGWTLSVRCQP